ncbi:FtsK/SpoIIIE domain-containing protein [Microbacterium sp. WCS2018Hpa-9]|uniref:FtsK/SpoIIIE domain-containing protein n=1 Tax=Microbacterium sp. WCS2018Hpa-9 TaxID=3073635 RepID=UPI002889E9AF|nr:FtsK/SpoIIIE domain-containing protein [Microbacterium sp. WCS2018Hpa-9]
MDSLPIAIPAAPVPARRPPTPFIAALVPVAAGVVLWLVTGSLFSLCFAALGPLMIFASLIDGSRSRRKASRVAETASAAAWSLAEAQLSRLHDDERQMRWHRHPDAAAGLAQPPLRGLEPPNADTEIVVGSGVGTSAVRASGGDGERERDFRSRCAKLENAPITAPLSGGVGLRGAHPIVASVARALVVQLCLRFGAVQMSIVGPHLEELGIAGFPQVRFARRGSFRLAVARSGDSRPAADAVIWLLDRDEDVPEGITTVIDVVEPHRASLRTPQGIVEVAAECMSRDQALATAEERSVEGGERDSLPAGVALSDLRQPESQVGLSAVVGRGEHADIVVDIVDDGPHAIVTGTTGSGKSELLVSWVTAMASSHGPDRVIFVLADFKGGTAFEPLRMLPQVAAVITDLDEEGARRGVSSLTAELRRRESVLAEVGARDVRELGMARLVIVVDEFAALLQEHADLGAVFTDIAARGRALGMHLILGTQRASGVIRDALAANCPLRVSLRVADAADSRAVIGTDGAAELPGGVESRGLALVRRPQDAEPTAMRVALTGAADLRAITLRWADADIPHSPWLPVLPRMLPLAALQSEMRKGDVILGRADDPERQRQPLEFLSIGSDRGIVFLGGPGSGRTSALRGLAKQHEDPIWIPSDPEQAWDALVALAADGSRGAGLVLCDDIDLRISELPVEYGQHVAQLWEQILRHGTGTTFALTATRAAGALGRLLDALPRRGLLRMPSRVDHLAAGGESAGFDRDRPPGRMRMGDREIQLVWVPEERLRSSGPVRGASRHRQDHGWSPRSGLTGLITAGVPAIAESLSAAHPGCDIVVLSAESRELEASTRPTIVLGEADAWQRNWPLWQRVRREGEALIRAENAAELRQLAGVRELPPYARPHAGRAWSLIGDIGPRRVVIPALAPR